MTPQNFNLINPVYSQMDNFFSYKIMDEDSYKNTVFPNTVTWTKTKQNGADVDLWTNITLANTLEMDGNKGKVNKLIRLNKTVVYHRYCIMRIHRFPPQRECLLK